MNTRVGRFPAALIVSGMTVGLVASGISSAAAAPQPTPRITQGACASLAVNQSGGYVVNDQSTNGTKCVVKRNGTWQWTKAKRKRVVKFKTSFRIIRNRGDIRGYATYRFVKRNKVIVKRVPIRNGKLAQGRIKLPRKGRWAVTATYRGVVVSSVVKARR